MVFERLAGRVESNEPHADEIKALEDDLRAALNEISRKTPEVVNEYQALTPEQQAAVSREILAYMEKSHEKDMQNLIRGAVVAGLAGAGIGSAVFNAPGGIVGGIVAASVTLLVPLIHKLEELQTRRFLDNK